MSTSPRPHVSGYLSSLYFLFSLEDLYINGRKIICKQKVLILPEPCKAQIYSFLPPVSSWGTRGRRETFRHRHDCRAGEASPQVPLCSLPSPFPLRFHTNSAEPVLTLITAQVLIHQSTQQIFTKQLICARPGRGAGGGARGERERERKMQRQIRYNTFLKGT